jgi:hypothetical protein
MQLNAVSLSSGGAVQSLVGIRTIVTPTGSAPRRFHLPLFLRFVTGGADQIAVNAVETAFQGAFLPLDYDTLHPPQPLPAALLADLGQAVVVSLDAPRRVRSIRLTANAPGTGQTIDLYRLDGNAVAEKPTVSAALQNRFAKIPDTVDFTDLRFAIRLRNAGGQPLDLNPAHVSEVGVRAYPTTPRLGIAPADALGQSTSVATLRGEIGKSASTGTFDLGEALAAALQRYFDALRAASPDAPLANPLDVALVIASDAPFRLQTTSFAITARLVQVSFASKAEKQVLRFTGGQMTLQSTSIALPHGAIVHAASLRAVESFGRDRAPALAGGGMPSGSLDRTTGIAVDTTRWTIQQFVPSGAITATGVAFGLLPLLEQTSLQVEIQEDWQGSPSGKRVADGTIFLDRVGAPGWVTLRLPDPITLPTRPHWLIVRAASGRAVWLTHAGSAPLGLLDGSTFIPLAGLETRYVFIVPRTIVGNPAPSSTLVIGNAVLTSIPGADGAITYDLTAALNAALHDAAPGQAMMPMLITITATSSLPGLLTLYPPHVEYDL